MYSLKINESTETGIFLHPNLISTVNLLLTENTWYSCWRWGWWGWCSCEKHSFQSSLQKRLMTDFCARVNVWLILKTSSWKNANSKLPPSLRERERKIKIRKMFKMFKIFKEPTTDYASFQCIFYRLEVLRLHASSFLGFLRDCVSFCLFLSFVVFVILFVFSWLLIKRRERRERIHEKNA